MTRVILLVEEDGKMSFFYDCEADLMLAVNSPRLLPNRWVAADIDPLRLDEAPLILFEYLTKPPELP